ncbi:hypothetical protein F5Y16DRAFT_381674 [Xylariaceae sp. FL0255]|nr:hypothetical protein F5Y16DRAFT_381674 [Xylariaceae sp. FL0255]
MASSKYRYTYPSPPRGQPSTTASSNEPKPKIAAEKIWDLTKPGAHQAEKRSETADQENSASDIMEKVYNSAKESATNSNDKNIRPTYSVVIDILQPLSTMRGLLEDCERYIPTLDEHISELEVLQPGITKEDAAKVLKLAKIHKQLDLHPLLDGWIETLMTCRVPKTVTFMIKMPKFETKENSDSGSPGLRWKTPGGLYQVDKDLEKYDGLMIGMVDVFYVAFRMACVLRWRARESAIDFHVVIHDQCRDLETETDLLGAVLFAVGAGSADSIESACTKRIPKLQKWCTAFLRNAAKRREG